MYTSIVGINKAKLLAALYNAARPMGLGVFQYRAEPMTEAEARDVLASRTYIDYCHGCPLKLNFSGDDTQFRIDLYDRDQGAGAAQRIIDSFNS